MKENKKVAKKEKKLTQYNINSIFDINGKDIKVLMEEIFINYCLDEFRKAIL